MLPEQPELVREWFRHSRREENRATQMMFSPTLDTSVIDRAEEIAAVLTSAFSIPTDVAEAYESWRVEYNAEVAKIRAARQARINAREITKIRNAACPSCFATHAGEC